MDAIVYRNGVEEVGRFSTKDEANEFIGEESAKPENLKARYHIGYGESSGEPADTTLSKNVNAKDAIKQIKLLNTKEEVESYVAGDTRSSVEKAAKSMIKAIEG